MTKPNLKLTGIAVKKAVGSLNELHDSYYETFKMAETPEEKAEASLMMHMIESWIENAKDISTEIEYESYNTEQGVLHKNRFGRYEIVYDDKSIRNRELNCGVEIELYAPNEDDVMIWHRGSIEHNENMNGYYFCNRFGSHQKIHHGSIVRKRM